MALKVTVSVPDLPGDTELGVTGLGLFVNGKARELTEEEERNFLMVHGTLVKDGLKDQAMYKVEGTATVKASELPETATVTEEEGGE